MTRREAGEALAAVRLLRAWAEGSGDRAVLALARLCELLLLERLARPRRKR